MSKVTGQSTATGDEVEFDLPSSSKKRKNREETNDQLPRKAQKKIYRPKVFSQIPNRTKKSQAKSSTPKPSTPKQRTPKQRKSHVKRGASCERQLFNEDSSTASNELGIEYNSMQSYHKVSTLSSVCLLQEKQIGPNFPLLFKKKRVVRRRLCLQHFLTPFAKRMRSKSFIRKRRHWMNFSVEGCTFKCKKLISRIKKIRSLMEKDKRTKELVLYKGLGELVPYKRSSIHVDVLLDEETLRVWNLLKEEKGHDEYDEMKKKYWENIRKIYKFKVESFMDHMHVLQGDRRFLPWKGSVLDSVVGVFLTQNVADYLSSSAYMTLASKFPLKKEEAVVCNTKSEKEMKENKENEGEKVNESDSNKVDEKGRTKGCGLGGEERDDVEVVVDEKKSNGKKNKNQEEKEKLMERKREYWDTLRKIFTKSFRSEEDMDSVDWEGVRVAKASKVAETISARGQHNIIGGRIQNLLKSLKESNESLNLEWLRYAPPKEVKEYLLTIHGLGLKSVECIRLLTLHHSAFPVDINVARIVVRLGWVPIQPLPESIQIHNLEMFPDSNKIQQYLWPRLCTLDPRQLYELHYQLITFGKVFCTKQKPNCNACPLKADCKYYASAFLRAKFALPGSKVDEDKIEPQLALPESTTSLVYEAKTCEPIIELPASPEAEEYVEDCNDIEDIPTITLNHQTKDYYAESNDDISLSTAIVTSQPDNIPMPKMKDVSRLKTERLAYVLPDNHPLLSLMQCITREADDPSPYLLILWDRDEVEDSCESSDILGEKENRLTVAGTLMIPCRTAMRGRFPLNGTYFQVNEVFADYASMVHPMKVPRKWLWNLENRTVYFGTTVSSIMRGFVCVRAFDVKTRAPRPISEMLHRNTTFKLGKDKEIKK
ncbi:hypothetical protein PHAVU_003G032300 [Phaseolus vulgaris]|uniref:Demeter RRM-fold domain-containing protein n=2 Tax=Phaseolus vulgaris TaxID=3885 RepID=V7C5I9_PHAVU|nr:hypothetical protein PHAVU_003G032300g [Phaseolus vulgaris]ESW25399.1 hypothetical protein PHAVU_003G032300g [Phaseolus vulgaris]